MTDLTKLKAGDRIVKERPILFSAPMVRALLDDRKTQTRRVVKPYPKWAERFPICSPKDMAAGHQVWWWDGEFDRVGVSQDCPYGVPGDRLWVRETWYINHYEHADPIPRLRPDDLTDEYLCYRATEDDPEICHEAPWRPSIHMPRWASRILLEITDVRVERLNDISEADCIAEGWPGPDMSVSTDPEVHRDAARDWYSDLWGDINGPQAWAENPWVWVVAFNRVDAA